MDPRKIKTEIRDAFDSIAEDYGPFMEKTLHTRAGEEMVEKTRAVIKGRVLDVGTGTGIIAITVARLPGVRVTAFDFSGKMVRKAVKNAANAGLEMEFLIDDAEEMPFKEGIFDVVISCLGMLWYRDKEKALREMVRVTGGNGRIIIIEEEGVPRRSRIESAASSRLLRFFSAIEELETRITLREVEEKMERMGLTPTQKVTARIDEDHGFVGVVFQRRKKV